MQSFGNVTLLITHYNRSGSLERLLSGLDELGYRFGDIVVSDDCSKPPHQEKLKALQSVYPFRLVTTPRNKGLGNNINKGQDAVTTPYTLYVQEDFLPRSTFGQHLADALRFMEEDPGLDIARFYAYFDYPILRPFQSGFSEMRFNFWNLNHLKFYMYSDHPHLRRSDFLQKFGRYPEGMKGDHTEYRMALSFLRNKGRGLFHRDFSTIFLQDNPPGEPSTMGRAGWRESNNPAFLFVRRVYLLFKWMKCSWELKFMKL